MIRNPRTTVVAALIAVCLLGSARPAALAGQSGGAGTGGLVRLAQEQRLAGEWRRVLMIGAHPDDEDTELLTILARGMGIETAYLSLTRGDGGQNLIGSELGEALGVLRTEELATARRIDGGSQFFTRAFDFGFSKTAEESLRLWNRDSVLKDMVRIIRRFRPQVIVSVWSGTPSDGHGHHQASGILSLDAFHAAGDSTRFPELRQEGLAAWTPSKFYRTAGRFNAAPSTLTFNGGVIDPATGLSLHQLAMRSRSQHRSQNQGNFEDVGPSSAGLRLAERVPSITGNDDSLFAGVQREAASSARDAHLDEVRLIRAGLVLDATTDDAEVTPGQRVPVTLTAWNAGPDTVRVGFAIRPDAAIGSEVVRCPGPANRAPVAPGAVFKCVNTMIVASKAKPTSPYYLEQPRAGDLYRWRGPDAWGAPSTPPLRVAMDILLADGQSPGRPLVAERELEARFRDPVLGEVRKPVMIVPAIAVTLQPNRLLWPVGVPSRSFEVRMEHLSREPVDAVVSLTVPAGWTTTASQRVHFTREGESAVATFRVAAPTAVPAGTFEMAARVIAGADTFVTGLQRIRYPHVRDRNIATPANGHVVVADVKFPAVGAIGYVRGGGDLVPEAMMDAGLPVTMLTGDALERGALDRFRVIVIGPRAYEADESLKRAQPRLMRWLDAGGTLIIQYQQTPYELGGFAPKPLHFVAPTQSRVTDETAPVTLLAAMNPVLRSPNRITNADFDHWIQERGLDFPPTYDPAWTPILAMHDPGEKPLDGALLIARVGRGTAVYTGLAFHRQLPAMVPGAWRLWANLLGAGLHPAAPGAAR